MLELPFYDLGYAAFLLGLRRERVRAWLDGCERGGRRYPPVTRPSSTGGAEVTWGEFVELGGRCAGARAPHQVGGESALLVRHRLPPWILARGRIIV